MTQETKLLIKTLRADGLNETAYVAMASGGELKEEIMLTHPVTGEKFFQFPDGARKILEHWKAKYEAAGQIVRVKDETLN